MASTSSQGVALLHFGYVSRCHGLQGEVVVRTFDPSSTALEEAPRVVARLKDGTERELVIESVREGPKGDVLVCFAGVERREAADELRGSGLFVRREDLEAPEEGEYFQGDLVGLEAVTPEGAALGRVTEIWSSGPVPNLVVSDGQREVMVPFAAEFIREVDLAGRRVVLVPPEYQE